MTYIAAQRPHHKPRRYVPQSSYTTQAQMAIDKRRDAKGLTQLRRAVAKLGILRWAKHFAHRP